MQKLVLALASLLFFSACRNNEAESEIPEIKIKGDTILVSAGSPILDHLIIQKSSVQKFSSEFRTIGTVRPVSGRFVEIASPFQGRIVKSYSSLGQKISAGSPVFEIASSDFYEATKSYFAAKSAYDLAQTKFNRQKELSAKGVSAQKDLEEAQSEALIAEQELEQAKATLKIFNIDETTLHMGQALKVITPISGEVIRNNITIGSYTPEDSEPLVIIADLSRVWVAALVKENYFGSIKNGDHVEITTSSTPDKTIGGTIYYISEMLEEETRSLEVIVECVNPDRELKLGMFCNVRFLGSPGEAILLPSTSIMKEQDNDYVLIEETKGRYTRRLVVARTLSPDSVLISKGITEGENVVIRGGIYLNL